MTEQVKQGRCDTCNYLMPLTESGDLIPHRRTYMREKGPFKGTLTTETCYGKPTATPAPSEDVPQVPYICIGESCRKHTGGSRTGHTIACGDANETFRAALATKQGEPCISPDSCKNWPVDSFNRCINCRRPYIVIQRLQRQKDALTKLAAYSGHTSECDAWQGMVPCTCGYVDALATANEGPPSQTEGERE